MKTAEPHLFTLHPSAFILAAFPFYRIRRSVKVSINTVASIGEITSIHRAICEPAFSRARVAGRRLDGVAVTDTGWLAPSSVTRNWYSSPFPQSA